jgi:hypothetical protein
MLARVKSVLGLPQSTTVDFLVPLWLLKVLFVT